MKKLLRQNAHLCQHCEHFCQHYRKTEKGFTAIGCGHCIYPRVKQRVKDETCRYWAEREDKAGVGG